MEFFCFCFLFCFCLFFVLLFLHIVRWNTNNFQTDFFIDLFPMPFPVFPFLQSSLINLKIRRIFALNIYTQLIQYLQTNQFDAEMGPQQGGPRSNGNEWILHIPQIFRTGAFASDSLKYHTQKIWCTVLSYTHTHTHTHTIYIYIYIYIYSNNFFKKKSLVQLGL